MISQLFRSTSLAAAILLSSAAFISACAESDEDENSPSLAALFKGAKATLGDGLKASEREGKPVSAKFEFNHGVLQLSIYTMKADGYTEVVVDPGTGALAKAEKITDAEDLKAAAAQKAAMDKATISLLAATEKAVNANAGYRAVSITPEMKEGHPAADITLLQGETFKKLVEKLD
jgi:hypothetical protein